MNSISERLKEERNRLNLTQEDLSNLVGVSRRTQTNYENGLRNPDANYLAAIAKHGVDISYVLTGEHSVFPGQMDQEREEFYNCVREVEAWLKNNNKTLTDKQIVKVALEYQRAKHQAEITEDQVALNLIMKTAVNL